MAGILTQLAQLMREEMWWLSLTYLQQRILRSSSGLSVSGWGERERDMSTKLYYTVCSMSSGISLGTLSLDDVMQTCVVYSLSMAWQLGRAIARARATHSGVVEAVVKQQNGLLLITGKVQAV